MDLQKFGPFGEVVAVAGALAATFSLLLVKSIGKVNRWTWMTSNSPSFMVKAGARIIAFAIMALVFVTISAQNYLYFGIGALLAAFLCFWFIYRFDKLRRLHIERIPLVARDGLQMTDDEGNLLFDNIVMGQEENLIPQAAVDFEEARQLNHGLTLTRFMSGYGNPVNSPESLWQRSELAGIANSLMMCLVWITLLAVVVLYVAAFVVEIYNHSQAK